MVFAVAPDVAVSWGDVVACTYLYVFTACGEQGGVGVYYSYYGLYVYLFHLFMRFFPLMITMPLISGATRCPCRL